MAKSYAENSSFGHEFLRDVNEKRVYLTRNLVAFGLRVLLYNI